MVDSSKGKFNCDTILCLGLASRYFGACKLKVVDMGQNKNDLVRNSAICDRMKTQAIVKKMAHVPGFTHQKEEKYA